MVDYTDPRWNEADSQNTAPSPNGIATGAAPSSVPAVIRAGMGASKRDFNRSNARGLLTNSGNAYTLTYDVPPSAYEEGVFFSFFVNASNTSTVTLSINGMPAKAVVQADGSVLKAGDWVNGMPVTVTYDGTRFRMVTTSAAPSFQSPAITDNSTTAATTAFVREALIEYGTPAGAVSHFAMANAPTGWLKANGDLVSRTTYARLFAAIGTTYGAGDGSTTFKLPDLRGEFVRALDDGRGVDASRAIGSAQGDDTKSHTHTATASTDSHSHTGTTASAGAHVHSVSGYTNTVGDHVHHMTGSNADNGDPGPYITTAGSQANGTISTGGGGAHSHSVAGTAASNGEHTHAFTTAAVSHTHTITVNATGGTETRPRNVALLACIKY